MIDTYEVTPKIFLVTWPKYRCREPEYLKNLESIEAMLKAETDKVDGRKRVSVVTYLLQRKGTLTREADRKKWLSKCRRVKQS